MMGRGTRPFIETHSCYCCLNSTLPGQRHLHTVINAAAWCAVASTEALIDQLVYSPTGGFVAPMGQPFPFFDLLIKQENCYESTS